MTTTRRLSITLLAAGALALLSAFGPTTPTDDRWQRLLKMPLEERLLLDRTLDRLASLPRSEQAAVRELDRRLAAESMEDRENYLAAVRRYQTWYLGLTAEQRDQLQAADTPERRMALALKIRADQRSTSRPPASFFQRIETGGVSPFDQARVIRAWHKATPEQRNGVVAKPEGERRAEVVHLFKTLKVEPLQHPTEAEVDELFERAMKTKRYDLPKKAEAAKAPNLRDPKRRLAEHYYFVENPPARVTVDHLAEFHKALPPWIRSGFEALPPTEARRRLTILYRLVFPAGSEMKPLTPGPNSATTPEPPNSPPKPQPPQSKPLGQQPPL